MSGRKLASPTLYSRLPSAAIKNKVINQHITSPCFTTQDVNIDMSFVFVFSIIFDPWLADSAEVKHRSRRANNVALRDPRMNMTSLAHPSSAPAAGWLT